VKHLHVVAHAVKDDSRGEVSFVGAVMDVTAGKQSQQALEQAFREIKTLKDQLQSENIVLREEVLNASMFEEIVGTSPSLQTVLSRISKVAPTDSSVLITGETGTGKELVARAIHRRSRRSSRAFVSVNCAAIPHDLIASELFGHEKGAFTGATQRRLGPSNWPRAARSSSTKLGSFLPKPRSLSCVFCRSTSLSVSVELDPSDLMFG
jgi:transcriptional regulator with GAF, ATPase, and Fis domain